jgi:hypothetical protein
MRFAVVSTVAFAGIAVAQVSPLISSGTALVGSSSAIAAATGGACAAQDILNKCVSDTTDIVSSCAPNDYGCLCQKYQAVLTCYNNCPNDQGMAGAQAEVNSNCQAASQNPTTTASAFSAAESSTKSANTGAATTAGGSSGGNGGQVKTSGTSTAAAKSTNIAAPIALPAGGLLAIVAGLVGAFL